MPLQIILDADNTAYDIYVGSSVSVDLTERERAFINSVIGYLLEREAWQEMDDTTWQSLETEIGALMDKLDV